ncbi:MAG: hypothetical protein IIW58_06650 [Bacteroidales bacterium]|nr:hypothetical protein [Bacteroidales bacterium]
MKIENTKKQLIVDLESWKTAFIEVDKKKNWEEGRSACTLAKYFTTPNIEESYGIKKIEEYFKALGFSNPKFNSAEIEHESRFDSFRGQGRMQDLVIWGESEKGSILTCIEAKVDESFDKSLFKKLEEIEKYLDTHKNSKRRDRIQNLCKEYLKVNVGEIKSGDGNDIRYQLLHYLAGSICEAKCCADVVFMPIMVFKTDEYNKKKGDRNRKDYEQFRKALKFEMCNEEKGIFKRTFEGIDVYISYIEIGFEN